MRMAATDYKVLGSSLSLDAPLMGSMTIHSPTDLKRWCNTLADSGCWIILTIVVDSGWILMWNQSHWLAYQIIFPSIYGSSKTESGCVLRVHFTAPRFQGGLKLDLGLHLGDSNRISFRPLSPFGCPCWSTWFSCDSLSMVICMVAMSTSEMMEKEKWRQMYIHRFYLLSAMRCLVE